MTQGDNLKATSKVKLSKLLKSRNNWKERSHKYHQEKRTLEDSKRYMSDKIERLQGRIESLLDEKKTIQEQSIKK